MIGIQYFRPPNPPRENWAEDLAQIHQMGFDTIRCWMYWRTVQPAPDSWDFDDYDVLFGLAARNGLKILVTLIAEAPPEWALREAGEGSLLVRPDGSLVRPTYNNGMVAVGGYPGFCLDEPRAKALADEFLRRCATRYASHSALAGFALQNEVMPFYTMADALVNHPVQRPMFQRFLEERYDDITRYNAIHLTNHGSFDEATMRGEALPADAIDRIAFCAHRVHEQLRWRRDVVRSAAPEATLLCHAAGSATAVTAVPWVQEDLADLVDAWGTSQYENNVWRHLLSAVVTRSAAGEKPWGVVEMTGGTMWTHYPTTARTPEQLLSLPLLFMSLGATTNLFWQYRPERLGTESPNFGLVLENGRLPQRAEAVARLARAVREHGEIFASLRFASPRIAVVVDWHGFAYEQGLGQTAAHAMRVDELAGIVAALSVAGFEVAALSSARWEQAGLPDDIRLLILPCNVVLSSAMLDQLEEAARRGVCVAAGPMVGHFDENGWLRTQSALRRLENFFGCARADVHAGERFTLRGENLPVVGLQMCEEYEPLDATPWLNGTEIGGGICGTRHAVGDSIRWRWGSFLGRPMGSEPSTDPAALTALLTTMARQAGLQPQHPRQPGLLIRIAAAKGTRVAFIRNPIDEPRQFVPDQTCQPARALDGESAPPPPGAPLPLRPQQTRVFELL